MTKRELLEALKDVPDDYKLFASFCDTDIETIMTEEIEHIEREDDLKRICFHCSSIYDDMDY